jgi:tight adherence protein B
MVPPARLRDVVDRVAGRDDEVWPAWLEAAGRSARAGASLRESLRDATDSFRCTTIGPHLVRFARVLDGGGPLEQAVDQLRAGDASTDDHLVVRALTLAVRTGGPAAVVLDAVASTLRERAALTREVRALSTQARASAVVMVVSPVAFAVLAGGADPRVLAFLVTGPGLLCLGVGVALDALGACWMARVVRGAV